MGIGAYFKQVPSYLLEKFLKYPDFVELYKELLNYCHDAASRQNAMFLFLG